MEIQSTTNEQLAHDKVQKIAKSISSVYDVSNSIVFKAFINALYQNPDLTNTDLKSAWIKIWSNQILLDNVTNALIIVKGKAMVHETLQTTTARICKEMGIIISAVPFSTDQISYLESNKLPLPLTHESIPVNHQLPSNISNTSLVLVKSLSKLNGECIDRQQYTTQSLLDSARKKLTGNIVTSIVDTRNGRKEIACHGPWNSKEDQLEMLKKTAIRKFIKYISR